MIKLFLFDIEGTTTDIHFVHKVLFPYSEKNLADFLVNHQNQANVQAAIANIKNTVLEEEKKQLDLKGVVETLLSWIRTDRKHGALKEIQGLIWDIGYTKNHFQGHVYEDVKPFFLKILELDKEIGIYSSGSVHAQKLIFGYSSAGDLTPMISHYFDTKVGGKREKKSYEEIIKAIGYNAHEIHFFSDIPEELTAAQAAGLSVTHVVRPGTATSNFEMIKDFSSFNLEAPK